MKSDAATRSIENFKAHANRKIREKKKDLQRMLGQMLVLDQAMDAVRAEIETLEVILRKLEEDGNKP